MPAAHSKQEKSALERAEFLEREREALEERNNSLRLEFINSEIDLAITFCRLAASTHDPGKSRRNLRQAERAHSAAMHFLETSRIGLPMPRAVQSKLSDLESLLGELRGTGRH